MVFLSRPYHFKFCKGCFPQISLGPLLNTFPHFYFETETLINPDFTVKIHLNLNLLSYIKEKEKLHGDKFSCIFQKSVKYSKNIPHKN